MGSTPSSTDPSTSPASRRRSAWRTPSSGTSRRARPASGAPRSSPPRSGTSNRGTNWTGGYTVYGVLESAERADERDHVPFELLGGATVASRVRRDEVFAYDDVELLDTFIGQLRADPDGASL